MTQDPIEVKLQALGFERPKWCVKPSEKRVRAFEAQFKLTLPADYRAFLVKRSGVTGSALCPFQEPTPCGDRCCVDMLYGFTKPERSDNVVDATERIDGAPAVIAVGENLMGCQLWMICVGRNAGHVFMDDHEGRSAWPDSFFYERFPALSPVVERYLELRRKGELPAKPQGFEHLYRVATSFTDFLERLEPNQEE